MNKEQSKENNKKPTKKNEKINETRKKQPPKIKKQIKQEKKEIKKQKRRKSKAWKLFRLILIIAIIILLIFAGNFIYRFIRNGGGLQGFLATAIGHNENTLKDLEPINFLVIGISGVDEDYKLADTIMICSYDPKAQKASILSIPRDTYVGKNKAKASASYKINAVYRNGENIQGMVKSIEDLVELEINNYIIIDTDALIQLVDAIGGVEFDVPIDMQYDDPTQDLHINLKAGYQKLNGQQAEWLVRFRHGNKGETYSLEYGDNDMGRMRTQREFITATLKQTMKPENLLHITKIAQIGFNNIQTNMKWEQIKDYIPYAVNFNAENLKTGVLPGIPELANGVWIYTPNKKQTDKLVEELFLNKVEEENQDQNQNTNNVTTNTISSSKVNKVENIKIELLNGTGKQESLTKAEKLLKEKGYNITKTGNTTVTAKTTIINRTRQTITTTNKLKQILKVGNISQKSNNSGVDYTITLGKDFK